jgi:hypothetical protein
LIRKFNRNSKSELNLYKIGVVCSYIIFRKFRRPSMPLKGVCREDCRQSIPLIISRDQFRIPLDLGCAATLSIYANALWGRIATAIMSKSSFHAFMPFAGKKLAVMANIGRIYSIF